MASCFVLFLLCGLLTTGSSVVSPSRRRSKEKRVLAAHKCNGLAPGRRLGHEPKTLLGHGTGAQITPTNGFYTRRLFEYGENQAGPWYTTRKAGVEGSNQAAAKGGLSTPNSTGGTKHYPTTFISVLLEGSRHNASGIRPVTSSSQHHRLCIDAVYAYRISDDENCGGLMSGWRTGVIQQSSMRGTGS